MSVGLSVEGPSTPCSLDPRSANQCVAAAVMPGLLHTDFSVGKWRLWSPVLRSTMCPSIVTLALFRCFKIGDIDLAKVWNVGQIQTALPMHMAKGILSIVSPSSRTWKKASTWVRT